MYAIMKGPSVRNSNKEALDLQMKQKRHSFALAREVSAEICVKFTVRRALFYMCGLRHMTNL